MKLTRTRKPTTAAAQPAPAAPIELPPHVRYPHLAFSVVDCPGCNALLAARAATGQDGAQR